MRQKAIPVDSDGEWQLYLVDTLQWGEFYVDSEHASTYISPATWETLSYSEEATAEFLDAYQEGAGMKRLVTDAGRFREAALAEVRSNGTDVPAAKDVLTCLAEEANALIVQAAALNLQPTPLQIESFAMRLTELRERFTEVETQVEGLRSLLDLAELSVLDAANG